MAAVTATAPVRVDLSGGATDCRPWVYWHGGVHVNIAVSYLARAIVTGRCDLDVTVTVGPAHQPAPTSARRLIRKLARTLAVAGVEVNLTLQAPPASGLGTSGAVGVAAAAALTAHTGRGYSLDWLAEVAAAVERSTGAAGGKQDQYAAAYGTAHVWDITGNGVCASRLPDNDVRHLAGRLLVAHPGGARASGGIVEAVAGRLRAGDRRVISAHHDLNTFAGQLPNAITSRDTDKLADLVNATREAQARLHPDVVDDAVHRELIGAGGVLAAKPCGGGGRGAAWLLLCDSDAAPHLTRHYAQRGITTLPVTVAPHGVCLETTLRTSEVSTG